jgi:excisionase family DNA binding protein
MSRQTPPNASGDSASLEPIFISVKEAARLLNLTPWTVYQLCDTQEIEAQYHGKRRLVRLASVRSYADRLPTERDAS